MPSSNTGIARISRSLVAPRASIVLVAPSRRRHHTCSDRHLQPKPSICAARSLLARPHALSHVGQHRTFFSLSDVSKLLPKQTTKEESGGAGSETSVTGGGGDVQKFHARRILPYTQQQLYRIVANVPSYSTFIPFCTSSTIVSRIAYPASDSSQKQAPATIQLDEKESLGDFDDPFQVSAELQVGFGGFNERFTSKVTGKPYELVLAEVEDSPLFNNLRTAWSFSPASSQSPHPSKSSGDAAPSSGASTPTSAESENGPTLLSIDISFSFTNPLHRMASQAFLPKISDLMVEAFERRCLEVYGPGKV